MAPATSRRSLAGGAVAALLGTAAVVGTNSPRAPVVDHDADATVIALCCEYVGLSARHADLCAKQDAMPDHHTIAGHAEWSRLDDLASAISLRLGDLEDEIPELPAVTPAGQRAKAEALLWVVRHISDEHGGPFARSLARDLVGRA